MFSTAGCLVVLTSAILYIHYECYRRPANSESQQFSFTSWHDFVIKSENYFRNANCNESQFIKSD